MTDAAGHRRGLGRGLSALLEDIGPPPGAPTHVGPGTDISVELLRRNPDQPRRTFDETELAELTESIRERGILQPILVRPMPGAAGEYQIVAGERRWRAAQRAGLHAIPAIVRSLDDAAVAEIAIVENVQRADLNALEEAQGYKLLLDRFGRTQEAVARAVGKSRSHIANSLRLLALPQTVRDHLQAGRLSAGHARAIAASPDSEALAKAIVDGELTVRQAEGLARKAQAPSSTRTAKSRAPAMDADTRSLEQDLSEALGMAVKIVDHDGRGEIRLRYETLDQLDVLCRRLSRE